MNKQPSQVPVPGVQVLQYLVDQETIELKTAEGALKRLDQTQATIEHTRSVIFEKRREYTGNVPLSPYFDLCALLHLDPHAIFPAGLKEAEQKNQYAEKELQQIRLEMEAKATRCERRRLHFEEMHRCAGALPGSLDHAVYHVMKEYLDQEVDITLDEAVGIALAKLYQDLGDGDRLRRIATSGQYALREVGNCAADAVFDPDLRRRMAERKKQVNGWTRHTVMKEYLRIAGESPDHSTVRAYKIEPGRLKTLPDYILYGLVVCGDGHAMRILKVEKNGLRVVEGNYDGHLNLGRFVPFHKLTWEKNLIVYSRQPSARGGLEHEYSPYDYTNPDKVGYESLREIMDDLAEFKYFKIASAERYARLPLPIRDSLSVLRFRLGKMYDITHYADLVDSAAELFPGRSQAEVVKAFLQIASENPAGAPLLLTISGDGTEHPRLARLSGEIPADAARQVFVFYDREGGEKVSLFRMREILVSMRTGFAHKVPRIMMISADDFLSLDEPARRLTALLTPRRDENGEQVQAEAFIEEQIMRVCPSDPAALLPDGTDEPVPLQMLMHNPLQALLVIERPFDMLGCGARVLAPDMKKLEKYPLQASMDDMKKKLLRKFEIRAQSKR